MVVGSRVSAMDPAYESARAPSTGLAGSTETPSGAGLGPSAARRLPGPSRLAWSQKGLT